MSFADGARCAEFPFEICPVIGNSETFSNVVDVEENGGVFEDGATEIINGVDGVIGHITNGKHDVSCVYHDVSVLSDSLSCIKSMSTKDMPYNCSIF